jgi:hypothetical protein
MEVYFWVVSVLLLLLLLNFKHKQESVTSGPSGMVDPQSVGRRMSVKRRRSWTLRAGQVRLSWMRRKTSNSREW